MVMMMTRLKNNIEKKQGVIHIVIIENGGGGWYALDKVIEEFPNDTTPAKMGEFVNNKDDDEK